MIHLRQRLQYGAVTCLTIRAGSGTLHTCWPGINRQSCTLKSQSQWLLHERFSGHIAQWPIRLFTVNNWQTTMSVYFRAVCLFPRCLFTSAASPFWIWPDPWPSQLAIWPQRALWPRVIARCSREWPSCWFNIVTSYSPWNKCSYCNISNILVECLQ